jgi:predicted ArsR family transcriptional regulator
MSGDGKRNELTQKIYEFIKTRGCATIEEIAQATGVSTRTAYRTMRTLFARRLVLPYRPNVGRERIYCVPIIGDKLYGRQTRSNASGMICITLPVDLIETIDEIAINEHRSRSSVIKEALMMMMMSSRYNSDNQQNQPEDEELDIIAPDR